MNDKIVSVIVSAYKTEKYIKECIWSILDQRLPEGYELELVLGIDGCQSTLDVVKDINHQNLKIYNISENIGVYKAFNTLHDYINGEFVTWFGADDIMGEDMLFNMTSYLIKNKEFASAGTQFVMFNDDLSSTLNHWYPNFIMKNQRLWRVKSWNETIGAFEEWKCGADSEACSRAENGFKLRCGYDGKAYACYRIHKESLSNAPSTKPNSEIRKQYSKITKEREKSYAEGQKPKTLLRESYNQKVSLISNENNSYNTVPSDIKELISETRKVANNWREENIILRTANMATIPERIEIAEKAINSIIDQVDIVRVYLNNFKEIPEFIKSNSKIEYIFQGEDLNASGKHFWSMNDNEYYFSIDDDIEYPPTYVKDHILYLNKFDNKVIVSLHGNILPDPPIKKLWKNKEYKVYACLKKVNKNIQTNLGGQGVSLRCTKHVKIDRNKFKYNFMDDIEVGIQAKEQGVPIIVRRHEGKGEYLDYNTPPVPTLHETYINNQKFQIERVNSIKWDFPDLPIDTCKKLSVIMSAYKSEDYIEEALCSVLDQKLPPNCEMEVLIGVDGCENTYNKIKNIKDSRIGIFKSKENIGTYNMFNSLLPLSKGEIFIRFDSDDIMGPDYLNKSIKNMILNKSEFVGSKFVCFNEEATEAIHHFDKNCIAQGIRMWKKDSWIKKIGGYEPWECSADAEANNRALFGNVSKFTETENVFFCYRKHSQSLTRSGDTAIGSDLRMKYANEYTKRLQLIKEGKWDLTPLNPKVYEGDIEGLLFDEKSESVKYEFSDDIKDKIQKARVVAKKWMIKHHK